MVAVFLSAAAHTSRAARRSTSAHSSTSRRLNFTSTFHTLLLNALGSECCRYVEAEPRTRNVGCASVISPDCDLDRDAFPLAVRANISSSGVVVRAIMVSLGALIADPIIGLVITLVIVKITWDSWRTVSTTDRAR